MTETNEKKVMHEDIQIRNVNVLNTLNEYKDFILEKWKSGKLDEELYVNCRDHTRDRWLADDYRERIMQRGSAHDGFPESMRSYHGMMPDSGSGFAYKSDLKSFLEYRDKTMEMNNKLMAELTAKRNSLATVYPPGGWISWHNNANASGYNVIFSWSENGDGWFDYWDWDRNERVRIQDRPGWQCKMTYFGSYEEPKETLCYHAASTDCLRISVAYVFSKAEGIWRDVIEDIETEQ
jgi:hypothetical protein